MRRILLFIVIAGLLLPALPVARPVAVQAQRKALFLSSMERFEPMRSSDMASITDSLANAGYSVTYLKDTAVTLSVLMTQPNSYQVVIWRTDVYDENHVDYWYIGQLADNPTVQSYASDFASGALDGSRGVLGASAGYFSSHLSRNSFSNVRLIVVISSMSAEIAGLFVASGAQSAIEFSGPISLQFNWDDYLTSLIIRYLANGYDVADAVSDTVVPMMTMQLEDPLDSLQIPFVAYAGNASVTIL